MATTVEDTVILQRVPNGAFFNVTAIVRNEDTRLLEVGICVTPVQRDLGGRWTTVFIPTCLSSGMTSLAAGDSLVVPVKAFGYTITNILPPLDPRMGPGRYRLLFAVGLGDATVPTGSSGGEMRPSAPFIVK